MLTSRMSAVGVAAVSSVRAVFEAEDGWSLRIGFVPVVVPASELNEKAPDVTS